MKTPSPQTRVENKVQKAGSQRRLGESFIICLRISKESAYWALQALRTHLYLCVSIRYTPGCGYWQILKGY